MTSSSGQMPAEPGLLDVAAIAKTVQAIKSRRRTGPSRSAIRVFVRQLQEHAALLMQQDLGPDDDALQALREGAKECSTHVPALLEEDSPAEVLREMHLFAVVTEGLLRRWCQHDTAGGDYEIRVEEDERGGYYVWDTVSGSRASLRPIRGDSLPAAHLPLDAAWNLTRRLNQKAR